MVTMEDVAREAGVARKTVYNVLNYPEKVSDKSKKKVNDAIKKLDYRGSYIAKSLVTGKTDTIGLILPEVYSPYYSRSLGIIETKAREAGYNTIICCVNNDLNLQHYYLDMLYKRNVDGIIICPVIMNNLQLDFSDILDINQKIPTISLNGIVQIDGISDFSSNIYKAEYDAVKYVYNLGSRDIVFLHLDIDNANGLLNERCNGYTAAMNDLGLNPKVCNISTFSKRDFNSDILKEVINSKPHAILSDSDDYILYLLYYANKMKVDIFKTSNLIGFDDSGSTSFVSPHITSIRQPVEEIAIAIVDELVKRMTDENYNDVVYRLFECKLVERETSNIYH